ncbi:MAG: MaoC family dehydratase N-terminal domain-containing protein [Dehalococcoidia bacterium]
MSENRLTDGRITEEALEAFRRRVGSRLRIRNVFNETASKDSIRKFADGIGDPNPLWRDETYAGSSCYGTVVAPPSWVASVFPTWVLQGLPGVHAFQSSTDWEFLFPVLAGDRITPECVFSGFRMMESGFSGRSVLEKQEARYYNQNGVLVARASVTGLRAERSVLRERSKLAGLDLPHPWAEAELERIESEVLGEQVRGSKTLFWEDAKVGDEIPQIVRGPLGLTDIIAYCIGASPVNIKAHGLALREYRKHPAWGFRDPETSAMEPIYGVHYNKAAAGDAGLPYPYDTAVQRHCWLMQMLTNWMGDDGWLKRSYARYRNFVFLSDVIRIRGSVIRKYIDSKGEHCLDVKTTATNQRGEEVMPGLATVILPSKKNRVKPVERRMRRNI